MDKLQKVFKKLQKRYSKSYKYTKKGIQKVTRKACKLLIYIYLRDLVILVYSNIILKVIK